MSESERSMVKISGDLKGKVLCKMREHMREPLQNAQKRTGQQPGKFWPARHTSSVADLLTLPFLPTLNGRLHHFNQS
jgi:hypothetical protein